VRGEHAVRNSKCRCITNDIHAFFALLISAEPTFSPAVRALPLCLPMSFDKGCLRPTCNRRDPTASPRQRSGAQAAPH